MSSKPKWYAEAGKLLPHKLLGGPFDSKHDAQRWLLDAMKTHRANHPDAIFENPQVWRNVPPSDKVCDNPIDAQDVL